MKHPVSRELYTYWDMLRGSRAAPERGDLDPAAIRGVLAHTFVLEVDGDPTALFRKFPIRLSGTRLNALFLTELKGRSILDFWKTADKAVLEDVLACVLDDRAAMVASVKVSPSDHPMIDLELLLLPLRHHGKTHARILGSLAPMVLPSWVGLIPVGPMSLASFRHVTGSPGTGGLAPTVMTPNLPPASKRHGRFTVYEGGR